MPPSRPFSELPFQFRQVRIAANSIRRHRESFNMFSMLYSLEMKSLIRASMPQHERNG
jgi:hypothetical protein